MAWFDPFFNAASLIIQRAGLSLPQRGRMNFASPLVATDNPSADATDVTFDGTVPAAPVSDALVLQSTGASSTAWRPVAPTLVPSGGSDVAQIAAGLAAAGHVALSAGAFQVNADTTIGSASQSIHVYPGATIKPASGVHVTWSSHPDVPPDQAWIDLSAGGTFSIADGGTGPTTVHPGWFVGCDRTGSIDSSAAVQAAIDALPSIGGIVDFSAGYYLISNILIASKNGVRLRGAHRFATTILDNSATASLFTMTSCGLVEIEDIEVRRPLLSDTKTGGVTFDFDTCTNCSMRRIRLSQPYRGIHLHGGGGIHLAEIRMQPGSTTMTWDYALKCENVAGVWARELDINMGSNVAVATALCVLDGGCDTIDISNSAFNQVGTDIGSYGDPYPTTGGTCVLVQNSNASFDPRWIHLTDVVTEAVNGAGIDVSAVNQLLGVNCTVQTSLIGIRVTGGNDIRFLSGFVNQIQQHGISLTAGNRISFLGYEVTGCSRALTNTYSALSVGGTAQDIHVLGCALGDTQTMGSPGYVMLYGISQSAGSSDDDADHIYRENVYGALCTNQVLRGVAKADYGTRFEAEGTTAPAAGTWARGDVVFNLNAADGSPAGWVCSVAGTPGTWIAFYAHAVAPTSAATANAPVIRDGSAGAAFAALTATGITVSGLTASQAVVTDGAKAFASLAYAQAATASTIAQRDSAGAITAAGFISSGTNPATVGLVRATKSEAAVVIRNAANGGNLTLVSGDGADNAFFGAVAASSGVGAALLAGDSSARLRVNGADFVFASGSNPAAAGFIRAPSSGTIIAARNAANGADLPVASIDGSDNTVFGAHSSGSATYVDGTDLYLRGGTGQTERIHANATGLGFFGATPVARPTLTGALSSITDANAKAVIQSIVDALKSVGGVGLALDSTT